MPASLSTIDEGKQSQHHTIYESQEDTGHHQPEGVAVVFGSAIVFVCPSTYSDYIAYDNAKGDTHGDEREHMQALGHVENSGDERGDRKENSDDREGANDAESTIF